MNRFETALERLDLTISLARAEARTRALDRETRAVQAHQPHLMLAFSLRADVAREEERDLRKRLLETFLGDPS